MVAAAPDTAVVERNLFTSLTFRKLSLSILGAFVIIFAIRAQHDIIVPNGGDTSRSLSYAPQRFMTGKEADGTQLAIGSIIQQLTIIQQQLNDTRYSQEQHLPKGLPEQLPDDTASPPAAPQDDLSIWVCTMVQDEMPYIIEWIEHLASQGVSSFMIFDDHSTDNIRYLPAFYQAHHPEVDVRVFKHDYDRGQEEAWQRCREMALARKARWVIVCDVDEYWWTPTYGTIKGFLKYVETQEPEVTQVVLNQARFGAGAITERYQYQLVLDTDMAKEGCKEPTWSDQEDMTTDGELCPVKLVNPAGLQLLIDNLIRRSPSLLLDEPIAVEALERKFADACSQDWTCAPRIDHKSMWRVDACDSVFTHECRTLTRGRQITATPLEMRSNHFYVRTKADAYLHAQKWGKDDPIRFYEKANDFHTSIVDVGLRTISGAVVRERLEAYLV